MSHNRFRPLNDNEIHMLERFELLHRSSENYKLSKHTPLDAFEVSYETIFNDNRKNPAPEFVICLIRCYIVEHPIAFVWRGVSRCAKGDTFNRQRGEALAFLRTIRHSKPVEI